MRCYNYSPFLTFCCLGRWPFSLQEVTCLLNETHTFHISNCFQGICWPTWRRLWRSVLTTGQMIAWTDGCQWEDGEFLPASSQPLVVGQLQNFQDCQLHQYITRTLTAWCKLYHPEAAWGGRVQRAAAMARDSLPLVGRPMPE